MRQRTLADLLLVVAVAVLAYVETFGWSEPAAGFEAIIALFAELDVGVYLVVAGVIGIMFVGYVAIYLPKRLASESSLRK
jgi:hypothetical protein